MNYQKFNTILMRVIAVLLMLVLLSTAAVTGRFARYISSASGSDSARVAKFNVDYTFDAAKDAEGNIIPGEFTLQVTNKSEVAVKYSVSIVFDKDEVDLTENSLDIKLKINDSITKSGTFDDATNSYNFVDDTIFQLAPNTDGTAYPMTFTLNNHKLVTDGTNEIKKLSTNKEFNFTVAVTATQID